jgi:hypothetical protein
MSFGSFFRYVLTAMAQSRSPNEQSMVITSERATAPRKFSRQINTSAFIVRVKPAPQFALRPPTSQFGILLPLSQALPDCREPAYGHRRPALIHHFLCV